MHKNASNPLVYPKFSKFFFMFHLSSFCKKKTFAFLIGIFVCSCSHSHISHLTLPVYYTDNFPVELINIKKNNISIDAPQHIEGTYNNKTYSVDAWIQMNDTLLNIVIFSSFGNTIAELKYTTDSLKFESSIMNTQKGKAEYIVSDIQLCFFSMDILEPHYKASGYILTQDSKNNSTKRTLSKDGKEILTITQSGNTTILKNTLRNYSYTITTGSAP